MQTLRSSDRLWQIAESHASALSKETDNSKFQPIESHQVPNRTRQVQEIQSRWKERSLGLPPASSRVSVVSNPGRGGTEFDSKTSRYTSPTNLQFESSISLSAIGPDSAAGKPKQVDFSSYIQKLLNSISDQKSELLGICVVRRKRNPTKTLPCQLKTRKKCAFGSFWANPDFMLLFFLRILSYPAGVPGAVNITNADVDRLAPGNFLNDTLIEFGLKYDQSSFFLLVVIETGLDYG